MDQRMSLESAGKLYGISANAMRARVKKNPDKYKLERDNRGKIWLWIDPEKVQKRKTSKPNGTPRKTDELKAAIEALKMDVETTIDLERKLAVETERLEAVRTQNEMLKEQMKELKEQRNDLRSERDSWRKLAQELAERKKQGWWPWRR